MVTGLAYEQKRALIRIGSSLAVVTLLLQAFRLIDNTTAVISFATLLAAFLSLRREFLRQAMFALRDSHAVLRADVLYVAVLLIGALVASRTLRPVPFVLLSLSLASWVTYRCLRRSLPFLIDHSPQQKSSLLRDILPLTAWSTGGAAVYWIFSQGFLYLVAAQLGLAAVAALSATRLLLMPLNLLSTGVGALLAPAAAGWLSQHGRQWLIKRLLLASAALGSITLTYGVLAWSFSGPLLHLLFKRAIPQGGLLIALWSVLYVSLAIRDQVTYLLTALGRFKSMSLLTLFSAAVAMVSCLIGMAHWGTVGALVGIIVGEMVNGLGIAALVILALRGPKSLPLTTPVAG